jgi:predicted RNA binding protein YcfA (HicA-like mRNA interferase family)
LKIVSGKHLCKVLERHGWILQRIHGSHHIYALPGGQNILTVPVHGNRDLKRGTLRSLMRAARLNESDL